MTDDIQAAAPTTEALPETAPAPDKPVEVAPQPAEPKPAPSRADAVKNAVDKALGDEKNEAKPEPEKPAAKPQKSEAEPETDEPAAEQEETAQKASEVKKPDLPAQHRNDNVPAKISPQAREQWRHVPKDIKAEIHRIFEASDAEAKTYQEDRQFREELREYDDLAKKAGVPLKQALARYVDIDKRLTSQDPNTRARTVLEVMQAGNVDPVKFAQAIMANPQQFAQQPQARPDPMVNQMAQQMQEMRRMLEEQQTAPIRQQNEQTVAQFTADKPDFDDLQEDIAQILKSGMIQKRFPGLSPDQLLTEAYRRAGGSYLSQPGAQAAATEKIDEPAPEPRPRNPAGLKSVSGAPTGEPRIPHKKLSRSAAVEKAMREAGL